VRTKRVQIPLNKIVLTQRLIIVEETDKTIAAFEKTYSCVGTIHLIISILVLVTNKITTIVVTRLEDGITH
jgi:hypothetical protein